MTNLLKLIDYYIIKSEEDTAVDNQENDLKLIRNSMEDKPIDMESSDGILILETFEDTKYVRFMFDDKLYVLQL